MGLEVDHDHNDAKSFNILTQWSLYLQVKCLNTVLIIVTL